MMLVNKSLFEDSVAVLYESVKFGQCEVLARKTSRQSVYCNAVRNLDLTGFQPDPKLVKRIMGERTFSLKHNSDDLLFETYRPRCVMGLLEHFREMCPNLRTLSKSASNRFRDSWTVVIKSGSPLEGVIQLKCPVHCEEDGKFFGGPREWGVPSGFTLEPSVVFWRYASTPVAVAARALTKLPHFITHLEIQGDIFDSNAYINPSSIGGALQKLQPASLSIPLVASEPATFVRSLATMHGSYLTGLTLRTGSVRRYKSTLTFADFQLLVADIATISPEIRRFALHVTISNNQELLAAHVLPRIQDHGPRLAHLDLRYTIMDGTVLLNISRLCSLLVRPGGTLLLHEGEGRKQLYEPFLDHIERLPELQRDRLMVADLRAMDVFQYSQILNVTFNGTGNPVRRGLNVAIATARTATSTAVKTSVGIITSRSGDLASRLQSLAMLAPEGTDEEILGQLDRIADDRTKLLQAVRDLDEAWQMQSLMGWRDRLRAQAPS